MWFGNNKYQRTTGGGRAIRRRIFMPIIKKGIAIQINGARYEIRHDGWRRLHP